MNTEIRRFVVVVSTLGLLASCAQTGALERQNDNMSGAAQSSSAFADHDSIVKGYENTAKEMAWRQKVLKAIIPLQRCTVRSEMGLNKS
ncbi:MAG: hypothetical protein ABJA60_13005 [Nitrosospira sp.]